MTATRKVVVEMVAQTAKAQAQLDAIAAEAEALGKLNPEVKVQIDRRAASQALAVLTGELKTAAKEAEGFGTSAAGAGADIGGMISPMTAVIGAGVALSPVIFTLGAGLGGLGIAAAGTLSPLLKAAQAAGGLRANLAKLDPEQQAAGQSLLGLQADYKKFEAALAPAVLADFSGAVRIAGHVLKDLQPVSIATGKALGTVLGQVDREFASQNWQQFFQFMSTTAGPDVKLLGDSFVNLLGTLPPLLEALQPVSHGILVLTDDISKAAYWTGRFAGWAGIAGSRAQHAAGGMGWLSKAAGIQADITSGGLIPAWRAVGTIFAHIPSAAGPAAAGVHRLSSVAAAAGVTENALGVAIGTVTTALGDQLAPLLASQGDWVSWKQAQKAAKTAIDAVHGSLNSQSAAALNADRSIITSTDSAIKFAAAQDDTKRGVTRASDVIQNQIKFLETHASKSRIARQEIRQLRLEEEKLRNIRQRLSVTATGSWHVAHGLGARGTGVAAAAGWRVPGFGGGDKWLALLEGGETVVSKEHSKIPAVASMFKAVGVPGFTAGGIAGVFSGSPPGLGKWLVAEDRAALLGLEKAVAAGVRAAMSGGSGFGGLGRAGLRQVENWWTGAGGPGGLAAHIAAAITGAESGFNPRAVQQGQPYATTGWGLWQITPGNSEPRAGIDAQLLDPRRNAVAAVAKYWQAGGGFTPWTTFTSGAYKQFMDSGGWLRPGWNPPMWNGTGRPEHLIPAGRPAGEDLGPLLRETNKRLDRLISLMEAAPAATGAAAASGTMRALNGLSPRIPVTRARGR